MIKRPSSYFRKALKILLWFTAIVLILLVALVYAIRLPSVQQYITEKALNYYQEKVNARASLDRLYVDFPSNITLEGLYLEDKSQDTLIYIDYLTAQTDLWELTSNKLNLNYINLKNSQASVSRRGQDTTFNFQFIIDAFASQESASDTTSQGFEFAIGEVEIEDFKGKYIDDWLGLDTKADIGLLQVVFSIFDLNNSILNLEDVTLNNTNANLILNKPNQPAVTKSQSSDAEESSPFYLSGNELNVSKTNFQLEDAQNQLKLYTDVGELSLEVDSLDLNNSVYTAKKIALKNSFISFDQFETPEAPEVTAENENSSPVKILAGSESTIFESSSFRFRDHNLKQTKDAFNPADLWLQKINLTMSDGYFRGVDDIEGSIHNLSLSEKQGFTLNQLEGDVNYSDKGAKIKNLALETSASNVSGNISLSYPSIETLADSIQLLETSVDIKSNQFDLSDIYYFQPDLKRSLAFISNDPTLSFEVDAHGSIDDIKVDRLNLKALKNTQLNLKGRAQRILDYKNAQAKFDSLNFTTSNRDLRKILGDTLIPQSINLPDIIRLTGNLNGSLNSLTYNLSTSTTYGDLLVSGKAELDEDSLISYDVKTKAKRLQVGKILQNNVLGAISSTLNISGRGVEPEDLSAKINGSIGSLTVKGYNYENINLDAQFSDKTISTKLDLDDDNLAFILSSEVKLFDSIPKYKASLDLTRADLQALNFTTENFKLRTKMDLDLNYKSLNQLKGDLALSDITFSKSNEVYMLDTVSIKAETNPKLADLHLNSSVLDIDFNGNFDIASLPDVLMQHAARYFSDLDSTDSKLTPQQFDFNIDVKNPGFISDMMVPGLTSFSTGVIKGSYNSENLKLTTTATIHEATYEGISLDSLTLNLHSDSTTLKFETNIKQFLTAGFEIKNIALSANTESNQSIKADFKIFDEDFNKRYHIGGRFKKKDSIYTFNLSKDQFMLNYDNWQVNENNLVQFLENTLWVNDLRLKNANREINIQSDIVNERDSVFIFDFRKFDLSFLGKGRNDDSYVLTGELDGSLSKFSESLKADIAIENFGYKGDTLGKVSLLAQNEAQVTNIKAKITSDINDVLFEGTIVENERLDLVANFNALDLSSLEAYTANQLSELEGSVNGNLNVKGKISEPLINGQLNFNQAQFKVNYSGSKYSINDKIKFNDSGLSFSSFIVKDNQGDNLTLDGTINTKDYKSYEFRLKLNATKFQLLNTTEKDNDIVYGSLGISANADITGSLKAPKIRTNLSIEPNSDVTYVIPESEIEVQNRKGVVEFFDADLDDDEFFGQEEIENVDSVETQWIEGMDLKANIDVTNSSVFHIVIDPTNRDQLTVAGDADLAYTLKPDGSSTLTGRYEVTSGAYNLNFNGIAKREFTIQQGSYLLWTGDPVNARLNVSAIYEVRAVPVEAEVNQKIPFLVELNIGGQLLSPEIGFNLKLKEKGSAASTVQVWVANVNQQESVLNKQVFSLLIFKSFLSTGSSSGNNNLAGTAARNSVSSILTSQLNKLGSKIKGLELSFDLESYESLNQSGQSVGTTELELGLQKQFFNNRVVVKLAGNFDLEGERRRQQSASDFAGDIKVEYKLTDDGRFRLIAFRQNEYDDLLQGDIAETGVGIIFVRDYNILKELFSKPEKQENDD